MRGRGKGNQAAGNVEERTKDGGKDGRKEGREGGRQEAELHSKDNQEWRENG